MWSFCLLTRYPFKLHELSLQNKKKISLIVTKTEDGNMSGHIKNLQDLKTTTPETKPRIVFELFLCIVKLNILLCSFFSQLGPCCCK